MPFKKSQIIPSLQVFNGEKVSEGDMVWDYDVDGKKILGLVTYEEGVWLVYWEDKESCQILNPLQLHKII